MAEYENRRKILFERLKPLLAEPVANLLSVSYEPRIDGIEYPNDFNKFVETIQKEIKDSIKSMSPREGGKIESLGIKSSRSLLQYAEIWDLSETYKILEEAINRGKEVKKSKISEIRSFKEVDRVKDDDGKPIGLWR